SIGTNFVDYKTVDNNQSSRAADKLAQAIQKDFRKAQQTHTERYDKQFGRFSLDLGKSVDSKRTMTERIANFKRTQDPALVALLAQFGRYLLICSSQPGGQPSNLQGLWNNSMHPAWDSK